MSGVSAFLWQAGLMLLAAYFAGACVGCWLRRALGGPPRVAMEAGAGMTKAAAAMGAAVQAGGEETTERFGRALEGAPALSDARGGTAVAEAPLRRNPERVAALASETPAATGPATPPLSGPITPPITPPITGPVTPPIGAPMAPPAGADAAAPAAVDAPPRADVARPIFTPPMTAAAAASALAARQRAERSAPAATVAAKMETLERPPGAAADATRWVLPAASGSGVTAPLEARNATPATPVVPVALTAPAARAALAALVGPDSPAQATPAEPVTQDSEPAEASEAGQAGPEPAAPVTPLVPAADDLTLISAITADDARRLNNAGITRFAEIAHWSADDVREITAMIGGDRRIARENWIEQAHLLSQAGTTAFTRRLQGGRPNMVAAPATVSAPGPGDIGAAGPPSSADGTAKLSLAAGVAAAATAALTPRVSTAPAAVGSGAAPPVAPRLETLQSETPPSEALQSEAQDAALRALAPAVSDRAAFGRIDRYRDDLQQIDGINGEVEKALNQQGVTRIAQIAAWSGDERMRIDQLFGSMNRVAREDWVGQAQRISGYGTREVAGETAAAGEADPGTAWPGVARAATGVSHDNDHPGDANGRARGTRTDAVADGDGLLETDAVADGDRLLDADAVADGDSLASTVTHLDVTPATGRRVRGLRSVRSEALIGGRSHDGAAGGDDLKRIRGVGVLIEKRLRAMGFATYADIGSWTQSDIDRVSQQLDFRGRIERENWIEQARILNAGGQTDFSRRLDRKDE